MILRTCIVKPFVPHVKANVSCFEMTWSTSDFTISNWFTSLLRKRSVHVTFGKRPPKAAYLTGVWHWDCTCHAFVTPPYPYSVNTVCMQSVSILFRLLLKKKVRCGSWISCRWILLIKWHVDHVYLIIDAGQQKKSPKIKWRLNCIWIVCV